MKSFKLNNGMTMPAVGLGTWQAEKDVVGNAVRTAILSGYKHIDGAFIYQNEEEIGVVYEELFSGETPKVKREDVFITSKLWNSFHHPETVISACDKTLKDLRLNYLDLYLMHWPVGWSRESIESPFDENMSLITEGVSINETWAAMEQLVHQGKVKAIGISNFNVTRIKDLMKTATIKPVVNQVELHPYLPQFELVEFCKQNDILVTAYSSLGSGKEPKLLEDSKVVEIAKKHSKTPSQVLLAWAVQRGISVIPKSSNEKRIQENFDCVFELPAEDLEALNNLPTRTRLHDPLGEFGFNPFFEEGEEGFKRL